MRAQQSMGTLCSCSAGCAPEGVGQRRATFDTDNIDIGPERRDYLDHRLSRVWEMNGQVHLCGLLSLCTEK